MTSINTINAERIEILSKSKQHTLLSKCTLLQPKKIKNFQNKKIYKNEPHKHSV